MGGDKQRSEGEGGPESEGEVRGGRGGAWRHRGVEEEAGGGQGKQEVAEAASARATPRLCSSSWQRRKRTREEEVGWAGWAGWWRQVGCG